ncbi:MAG: hypothetical protein WD827_01110 [Solirubrobacterales bacterium]
MGKGWWWTLSKHETNCMSCGVHLLAQEKIAYHHKKGKIFCPDCAQAKQVSEMCEPSRKLLKIGS